MFLSFLFQVNVSIEKHPIKWKTIFILPNFIISLCPSTMKRFIQNCFKTEMSVPVQTSKHLSSGGSITRGPYSLWHYLRNVLIEDCLVEVFEYLHVHDLMQICDLDTVDDQFFTEIITNRVIGKKLIDLEPRKEFRSLNVWKFKKTFQIFGPFMKRLRIPMRPNHLNYVLRQIIVNCTPDTLTDLQFIVYQLECGDEIMPTIDLFQQIIPYFRSIQNLVIEDETKCLGGVYSIFLNSTNLKTFKLNASYFEIDRQWYRLITIDSLNLTKLHLDHSHVYGPEFVKCFQKLPHLEEFIWIGNTEYADVGNALAKYCPKLRVYSDFSEDRNDNIKYYDFLGQFNHLSEVTLTSNLSNAYDVRSTLEILSRKNQLRKLTIYCRNKRMIEQSGSNAYFNYRFGFSNLECMEFQIHNEKGALDFSKRRIFFHNLMASTCGLKKIKIINGGYISNAFEVLDAVPYINELDIHGVGLFQMPAEVRRFKRCIQRIVEKRMQNGNIEKLRLIVNTEQKREFSVLNGIDEFVTLELNDEIKLALFHLKDYNHLFF